MLYPPPDVCRALWRFNKDTRLGWDGELGTFALLQLVPRQELVDSFRERWDGEKYFGPSFSANGAPHRDWDYWAKAPVYLIEVPPEAVYSGAIVRTVRDVYARPIMARTYEDAKARAEAINDTIEGVGEEAGHFLYKGAQSGRLGAHGVTSAMTGPGERYFAEASGQAAQETVEELLPPAPPGGWDKHLAQDRGADSDLGSIWSGK